MFDGACRNVAGQNNAMGIGLAVFFDGLYSVKHSNSIHAELQENERGTSNVAEWIGCVEAMRKAAKLKKEYKNVIFEIYSDSQIITNQFNKVYVINKESFMWYFNEAHKFSKLAGVTEVIWVRREFNKEADKLSKQGLKVEI